MDWTAAAVIPVTLATAGLLGLIYMVLSVRVTNERRKTKVSVGDGGGTGPLLVAVRSQANFAEYVPIILILFAGIELAGGSHGLLVILAVLLVAGRIAHPLGMGRPAPNPYRAGGAVLTWLVLLIASLWALLLAL